jgi:hypothetical protein
LPSAFVEGTVLDASGNPVANAGIHIFSEDFVTHFGGLSDSKGAWRISVIPGTYFVEIFPPFDRQDLIKPLAEKFSVSQNETKSLTLRFGAAIKTIRGEVRFSDGSAVLDAEVGAYNDQTKQWLTKRVDSSGGYSIITGPGKWTLGVRPIDPTKATWYWQGPFQVVEFASDTASETKTATFTVLRLDSKVSVRVIDQNGVPLANAGVVLDTVSASSLEPFDPSKPRLPPLFRNTDSSGSALFSVSPGTYYLRAFIDPRLELIPPEEQKIELQTPKEVSLTLVFKKKETVAHVSINGTVRLEDGTPTEAIIWAWSEGGQAIQAKADSNGRFTLSVPVNTKWRVGAAKEVNGIPYKSSENLVGVTTLDTSIELVMVKLRTEPLAPALKIERPATEEIFAVTKDGAKVSIPPLAALPSGNVIVEIKPTIEAPNLAASKVVSVVYDVTIKDAGGAVVRELQKEIEVAIPYNEAELRAQGATPDTVVPSFFDESTGAWVKIDKYVVDKQNKVAVAKVKHLTRFALVAASDSVPPLPPTNVSASATGLGRIRLTWTNPTEDFAFARVYRSSVAGVLGAIAFAKVEGTFVEEAGLEPGRTYYYVIRAVDAASNESNNTNQVAVKAGKEALLVFGRNLSLGSRGDDVRALQQLLIRENVYPQARITGFYGPLTRSAVVRFQEKYSQDILAPLGRVRGTGYFGPLTRAKANALMTE